MRKKLAVTTSLMSLMLLVLFIPGNAVYGEIPEYCSDKTGKIVCEISILPYSEPGSYSPETAKIPVGASVIFRNTGPEIHTSTSTEASPEASPLDASSMVNGIFDTGILGIDGVAEPIVMNDPGVFYYYCAVHPDMRGTLIVGDATIPIVLSSENTSNRPVDSTNLDFTTTSAGDKSITGGELPLTTIKSVGNTAYIIDGTTPKGGHDAFSYDGSGHKRITGNIQVDLDHVTNTGSITAEWTDPEGNNWRYHQTKFAGGNEMYIGETINGVTQTKLDLDPVAINHFEHGTTGAGPTIEPTLFVYLA
jgi:plastocyanin